jgi:hypothetical protein
MQKLPNKAFLERHRKVSKNASNPSKTPLFAIIIHRQCDVLSWKMIARHHSKVHRTDGTQRVFFRLCSDQPLATRDVWWQKSDSSIN